MSDPRVTLVLVSVAMAVVIVAAIWLVRRVFTGWLERNGYTKK